MIVTLSGDQRENPVGCNSTEACRGGPLPVMDKEVLQGMGYVCCTPGAPCEGRPDRRPHRGHESDEDSEESSESSESSEEHHSRRRPQRPHRPVVSDDDQDEDDDAESEVELLNERTEDDAEDRRPSRRTDNDRRRSNDGQNDRRRRPNRS